MHRTELPQTCEGLSDEARKQESTWLLEPPAVSHLRQEPLATSAASGLGCGGAHMIYQKDWS